MSTRHHLAYIFIVRRQGPDGRKGSTMNSTATRSTWRGMGSVRLYFACDSPCDDNTQPYHTGSVAAWVNKGHAFRNTPGRRCQVCYWYIIEDSWKRQHHHRHMEHKDTKSCLKKLQELTHELDRYSWNIIGLCRMRWTNFGETTTEEWHKAFSVEKRTNTSMASDVLFTRTVMGCHPISSSLITIRLRAVTFKITIVQS